MPHKPSTRRANLPPGPGPGRKRGIPNRATRDIKEAAEKLLSDKDYVQALKRRLVRGTAGAVEVQLYHYAYGKPKDTTEVTGVNGGPLVIGWMKGEA